MANNIAEKKLLHACKKGDVSAVRELVKQVDNLDCVNQFQSSPLIVAVIKNHEDIVHILVEHGANLNLRGPQDWTALHCASFYGRVKLCEILLQSGAKTDLKNENGKTPGEVFDKSVPDENQRKIRGLIVSSLKDDNDLHESVFISRDGQMSCKTGFLNLFQGVTRCFDGKHGKDSEETITVASS
mmetsp:Transcript_13504/g.17781  ORF Transcript_13504/g.17781 Transcript_13504/m.17781 type:complete len:185 (-) Transcript_13504:101-655(-)